MAPMHCAGCGSKVGHTVLSAALERLRAENSDASDSISYGDDAALIEYPPEAKIVTSVDHFKAFIEDPYLFGAVTATHCLSDVYAMGAEVHNALASVTLPYSMKAHYGDILYELLAGAYSVLRKDNAALVGGHTAEGEDFFFGLTVNGVFTGEVIPKRGGVAGDVLILSKAIGTGVLLVGDQLRITRGPWLRAAFDSMLESNREAAGIFREYDARSMTDITGFGLVGHLLEMVQESEFRARVDIESIPLLTGTLGLSDSGLRSTLYPENIRVESDITNLGDFQMHPRYPLLFDPQTSGGLLAMIPEENAEACLAAFADSGNIAATKIGLIEKTTGRPSTIVLQ
jgi:selenide, water dikinase